MSYRGNCFTQFNPRPRYQSHLKSNNNHRLHVQLTYCWLQRTQLRLQPVPQMKLMCLTPLNNITKTAGFKLWRLCRLKPPCTTPLFTTTWCDSSVLMGIWVVGVSPSFKLHVWQEPSLHSSSVAFTEVHAIAGRPAHCCWGWLKRHQSLSLWLWIHHMSAYMRALNNNPSLNIPPQSKMQNASLPTTSSFGNIISLNPSQLIAPFKLCRKFLASLYSKSIH